MTGFIILFIVSFEYRLITGNPQFGQGQSFVSVPHRGQVILKFLRFYKLSFTISLSR